MGYLYEKVTRFHGILFEWLTFVFKILDHFDWEFLESVFEDLNLSVWASFLEKSMTFLYQFLETLLIFNNV